MSKKTICQWCFLDEAWPKPVFLNRDGSKNMSDPWLYTCFFLALGITITTSVAEQYQAAIAWLFLAAGAVVVIRLVIWRWHLPLGVEYTCAKCGYMWYEQAPVIERQARQQQDQQR